VDWWEAALVAVLTSGTTSAVIGAAVKAWIESRIRLEHESRLETLKAELLAQNSRELERLKDELRRETEREVTVLKAQQDRISQQAGEVLQVRVQTFPKLSELVYRIRNEVRELRDDAPGDAAQLESLAGLIKDLEARTFELRLPLEQAGVFSTVHQYKRNLQTFLLAARELAAPEGPADGEYAEGLKRELAELYEHVDRLHNDIIAKLAVLAFGETSTPPAERG
jgi:hypothetical protein